MGITKKQYEQPSINTWQYEGFVLTSSGEGDPFKDPSREDIYGNFN